MKKGFISMSLVYSFLILFLLLMLVIVWSNMSRENLLNSIVKEAKTEISAGTSGAWDFKISGMSQTDSRGTKTAITTTPTSGKWILEPICTGMNVTWNNDTYSLAITISKPGAVCTLNFKEKVPSLGTLINKIKQDNNGGKSDASVNFATPSSTSGDLGLYYTTGTNLSYTEGGKISYYYRGAVQNNFVKFGKNSSNEDLYWRIIRIDEDGNIRLIYNGTTTAQTGTTTQIGTSAFNSSFDQNTYVGYMYGTPGSTTYEAEHTNTNNSTIKTTIDNWFATNMTEERTYLSEDAVYCNNRKLGQWDGWPNTGYGNDITGYKEFNVHLTTSGSWALTPRPDYKCPQVNDQFTTTTATKGNKKLTYPVGLITASEVAFAGVKLGEANSSFYLNTGQAQRTLSPGSFNRGYSRVFFLYSNGNLGYDGVSFSYAVRPVISLKSSTEVLKGNGTASSPYEIMY